MASQQHPADDLPPAAGADARLAHCSGLTRPGRRAYRRRWTYCRYCRYADAYPVSRTEEHFTMRQEYKNAVMDVFPWPNGKGFAGADLWWDYVLTLDERRRLDSLLGAALLDESIRQRLLKHDEALLTAFGISADMQR